MTCCIAYVRALAKVTLNKAKLDRCYFRKAKAVCEVITKAKPILAIDRQLSKAIEKSSVWSTFFRRYHQIRAELDQMKARYQQEIESYKNKNRLAEESKIQISQEDFSKPMERASSLWPWWSLMECFYKELLSKVVMHSGPQCGYPHKNIEEPIKLHFKTRGHGSSYRVECAERN